ncbi:MAG: hypothetical protein V1929_01590 [bacterium]
MDPALKRELHSALAADGTNLKEWFLQRVRDYFGERYQPPLPGVFPSSASSHSHLLAAEPGATYTVRKKPTHEEES